jgi:ribosomal-protein-alanine N-acetyltransferase
MARVNRAYFLQSARLGFSHWSADDLPLARALWGDAEVRRFLGGPLSDAQVQARMEREMAWARQYGVQYWPVFLLAGGAHAGCAGLRPHQPEERIYELGYHLRPQFWRQGLAAEAGQAVIDYAFKTLAARALYAGHHPDNAASARVLQKLGFRHTHDEFYAETGSMHPCYLLEHGAEDVRGLR